MKKIMLSEFIEKATDLTTDSMHLAIISTLRIVKHNRGDFEVDPVFMCETIGIKNFNETFSEKDQDRIRINLIFKYIKK